MPIKRPLHRRFFERTQSVFSILLLPFIALLPLELRTRIMSSMAPFFWPLVRSMLVPATQRDPHKTKPLGLTGEQQDHEQVTILFGGNDCLRNEIAPLVDGISFFDGTVFHTKQRPVLLMPLIEAPTEKEYIDKIFETVTQFIGQFQNLKKIYIIGHSLGAAITIQLVAKMRRDSPSHLEYYLALDRSFSCLSDVVLYLYPFTGIVMARTLGLNWHFLSAETLKELSSDKNVFCQIYQITPDHVIGPAELLGRLKSFFEGRSWPERWSYRTLSWPAGNNAHILPFEEAFSVAASKNAGDCQQLGQQLKEES